MTDPEIITLEAEQPSDLECLVVVVDAEGVLLGRAFTDGADSLLVGQDGIVLLRCDPILGLEP